MQENPPESVGIFSRLLFPHTEKNLPTEPTRALPFAIYHSSIRRRMHIGKSVRREARPT
jgi:hypothetical protein